MAAPQRKPATYQYLLEAPENRVAEIINGERYTQPRKNRALKMPLYARYGVQHLWLVEPTLRTLEVFENTGNGWLLLQTLENDNEVSIAPFAAIAFSLAVLWAD